MASKKRNDKAVKVSRDIAVKAKTVVDSRIIKNAKGEVVSTVSEYLSILLRHPVERDWQKAVKKLGASETEQE